MCRKIGLAAVLVVAGLAALGWAGLGSYTSTAWNNIRSKAKKQVPLEFEIERLRNQVSQLVPDMKKNFSVIAEETVAVENLRQDIDTAQAALATRETELRAAAKALESGAQRVVYKGHDYTAARAAEKLNRDFASFKRAKGELESKRKLLDAKEVSLDAAKKALDNLRTQKAELEVQVAQLEAELKTLRLTQTKGKLHLDDSKLSQAKATLSEIRNRLNVEQKVAEIEDQFESDGDVSAPKATKSAKDVGKDISAGLDADKDEKVAGK